MYTTDLALPEQPTPLRIPTDHMPLITSHYEWTEWRVTYHNAMVNCEQLREQAPFMKVRTRESAAWYERAFRAGK